MKPQNDYAICEVVSRRYFWLYAVVLVGLLIWGMFSSFHGIGYVGSTTSTWWHGDVPWVLLTASAWVFSFISGSGQKRSLRSIRVREDGLYEIEGETISGEWRPRRKPQAIRALVIVLAVMVCVVAGTSLLVIWMVFVGHHNPTAWSKQNAIVGLCTSLLMGSNLMRYSRAIGYDYVIQLTQSTRWMTLAMRRSSN